MQCDLGRDSSHPLRDVLALVVGIPEGESIRFHGMALLHIFSSVLLIIENKNAMLTHQGIVNLNFRSCAAPIRVNYADVLS